MYSKTQESQQSEQFCRRFPQNIRTCKKSQYNVRNCKSGRHNQSYTFRRCNSGHKPTWTNIPYNDLKVKGRRNGNTKTPSPQKWNQILCAINLCQDNTLRGSTKTKPPFLPYDEPNLCNDYLLRDSEYIDCSCINFSCYGVLNQVDSNMDLLNNVILTKVALQSTTKTKECRPTQIKIKENNKQKEITPKNKKVKSENTRLSGGFTDSSNDEKNIL